MKTMTAGDYRQIPFSITRSGGLTGATIRMRIWNDKHAVSITKTTASFSVQTDVLMVGYFELLAANTTGWPDLPINCWVEIELGLASGPETVVRSELRVLPNGLV